MYEKLGARFSMAFCKLLVVFWINIWISFKTTSFPSTIILEWSIMPVLGSKYQWHKKFCSFPISTLFLISVLKWTNRLKRLLFLSVINLWMTSTALFSTVLVPSDTEFSLIVYFLYNDISFSRWLLVKSYLFSSFLNPWKWNANENLI